MDELQSLLTQPVPERLHHPSQHHQRLGSALLTSSLHKNHGRLRRPSHLQLNSHQQSLITNGLRPRRQQLSENRHTNIQELKYLAKKLEEEQIVQIGKENQQIYEREASVHNGVTSTELLNPNNRKKRLNKRKIVKGRPEVYAVLKKSKWPALINEHPLKTINTNKENPNSIRFKSGQKQGSLEKHISGQYFCSQEQVISTLELIYQKKRSSMSSQQPWVDKYRNGVLNQRFNGCSTIQ